MKAYEIGEYERGYGLRMVERPALIAGPGQAVMKVRATGFNARDLSIMRGNQFGRLIPPARIPLMDNAGDIVRVGPGVTSVKPGDRVTMCHYWKWLDGAWDVSMCQEDYSLSLDGFLAEEALVPAAALIRIPDAISYEEASTFQSAGLTAWQAVVEVGRVGPGDVVVTLGTGGVSVFGMQWAKMLRAHAIVTSSSDEKLERMRVLGADMIINYRTQPDWSRAVLDLTGGRGADVVLNTVGMAELEQCLLACASGGRVMQIGANSVAPGRQDAPPVALSRLPNLILKDLTIKGIVVGSRRMYSDLMTAVAAHGIKPVIDRIYDFDQAREALDYMITCDKIGKIVIRVQ